MQILTLEDSVEQLIDRLPVVAFALAAEDIDLGAGPEEGEIAETTAASDAEKEADALGENLEETDKETAKSKSFNAQDEKLSVDPTAPTKKR